METKPLYWIWLGISLSYASRSVEPLINTFGDAETVYAAGEEELRETKGVNPAEIKGLLNKDLSLAEEVASYCMHMGVGILPYCDERYPQKLRATVSAPAVLYYRGRIPDFEKHPSIGMVGTRSMSHYGANVAFEMAYDIAAMGCTTVSGLALGIDGVCNAASLAAGGTTVAVLGSGIDRVYPPEHKVLYNSIIEKGGLVLTEFPPYEKPEKFHFPIRNRIIAALSDSLIMVEGDGRSGALITAKLAKACGKTVFTVPGNVFENNSEGPLLLLREGARAIANADEIYEEYKESHYGYINGFKLNEERNTTLGLLMEDYDVHCESPKATPDFESRHASVVEKRRKMAGRRTKEEKTADAKRTLRSFFAKSGEKSEILSVAQGAARSAYADADFLEGDGLNEELVLARRNEYVLTQLEGTEKKVFERLMTGAKQVEDLLEDDLDYGDVTAALVMMESEGYVESCPGDLFRIKR